MANAMRELRLAARTLARKPGFTAITSITLALGIGANVAIFSIVNAILLRPLAYEDSERIVELRHHAPGLGFQNLQNSPGMVRVYREHADFLEALGVFSSTSQNLTGQGEASRVRVATVSPEVFTVLRAQPLIGRPFNREDVREEGSPVAILSHGVWTSRFAGDPSIVGKTIELDGRVRDVVGVMARDFTFPDDDIDVYTALWVDPVGPFGTFGLGVISRLAPGVDVDAAQARSEEIVARLPELLPDDVTEQFLADAGFSVSVKTLRERLVVDVESILWILLGTVAFLLLIACANVANLFLVRAESRQKEMAVRAAMGAGRRSVAASFLSESLILGGFGGVLGLGLAAAALPLLLAMGEELPRASEVSLDASSLALTVLLAVAAALLFGTIAFSRFSGSRFAAVLREGGRANTGGRERHRARSTLVASQLALALVLLVGSGLMLRSFAELRAVDLGIDPEGVLTVGMNRNSDEDPEVSARFFHEVAERVSSLPGVTGVGLSTALPLAGGNHNGGSFYIESKPRDENALPPTAMYQAVGADYFGVFDVPLLAGRPMERADWEETRPVVWINQQFERTYLDGDGVGERIRWGEEREWAEVVGVVGDVRQFGLADEDLLPGAYFPLAPVASAGLEIHVGFLAIDVAEEIDPISIAPAVRAEIGTIDSQTPVTSTRSMHEIVAASMEEVSVTMTILSIATAMALFLGAIGLAGVISYVVGQRTREIGVRIALGAEPGDVGRMILRQSMLVTAVGTVLGLGGAFGLTRLMEAILFEVSATDPLTFVTAPLILVAVSLLATWLPVRRATRVDPTEALRADG